MNKKLFVGRLPFSFSNDQLRNLFLKSGTVTSAVMVPDAKSGRTRGFGFVDMSTEAEAEAAIRAVNGTPLEDKKIWVTLAREKGEEKPSSAPPAKRFSQSDAPRRPFSDRSGPPRFGAKPGFGPKKHFTDGATSAPGEDRRPSFRGQRPFPRSGERPAGAASHGRPSFPSGERRPFRGASGRPERAPGAGSGAGFPKKEFRPHDKFRGPPKRAGGKRPPPRA